MNRNCIKWDKGLQALIALVDSSVLIDVFVTSSIIILILNKTLAIAVIVEFVFVPLQIKDRE